MIHVIETVEDSWNLHLSLVQKPEIHEKEKWMKLKPDYLDPKEQNQMQHISPGNSRSQGITEKK